MTFVIRQKGKLSQFSESVQKAAVYDYDVAGLSADEIVLKYGLLSKSVIFHWRKKYHNEIAENLQEPVMNADSNSEDTEHRSISELEAENRRLRKELERAQLKVVALDTMIDVAEQELRINIRKKSGTKQSGR